MGGEIMYLYLSLNERAVAQELINKVKSKCCGIKDKIENAVYLRISGVTPLTRL